MAFATDAAKRAVISALNAYAAVLTSETSRVTTLASSIESGSTGTGVLTDTLIDDGVYKSRQRIVPLASSAANSAAETDNLDTIDRVLATEVPGSLSTQIAARTDPVPFSVSLAYDRTFSVSDIDPANNRNSAVGDMLSLPGDNNAANGLETPAGVGFFKLTSFITVSDVSNPVASALIPISFNELRRLYTGSDEADDGNAPGGFGAAAYRFGDGASGTEIVGANAFIPDVTVWLASLPRKDAQPSDAEVLAFAMPSGQSAASYRWQFWTISLL